MESEISVAVFGKGDFGRLRSKMPVAALGEGLGRKISIAVGKRSGCRRRCEREGKRPIRRKSSIAAY